MAFSSSTGLFIFHLAKNKPLGTCVILEEPFQVLEGRCCRHGCIKNATTHLELGISKASPFGFNIAFTYEDDTARAYYTVSTCENCKEDPQDDWVFMLRDEERFGVFSRCTLTSINL